MHGFASDKGAPAKQARHAPPALVGQGREARWAGHLQRAIGNQAVQRLMNAGAAAGAHTVPQIHASAAHGVSGSAGRLPYGDAIQRSFGRYAVDQVRAFVGGPAREANERIGALAYATGESVAFRHAPDLHTAAHEAAHVVQQRAGVALDGGVGQRGDRYEQHADRVAEAVVQGQSAEPLLDRYAAPGPARAGAVQFADGPSPAASKEQNCKDLLAALENSEQVIALFRQVLAGTVDWKTMQSKRQTIGNAAQGVVGAGTRLPKIVQEAVAEVESFGLEEVGHMGRLVWSGMTLLGERRFQVAWLTNEIERQNHFNQIVIRKLFENGCSGFSGDATRYKEQILAIGTKGLAPPRSTIESPRETRTALAVVTIGTEQVMILATEVAGTTGLRFEQWIDKEFKTAALHYAAATQGSIPTVAASVVTGLPLPVPASAARR